jgi:gamma-glutamylcyclotransferase (GGCT)/AIG2-like uncharacterized protein YtfP
MSKAPRKPKRGARAPSMRKKETQTTHLFVYGTLRKAVGHPMYRILDEYGIFEGMALFRGKLYDLGRFPGVVASGNATGRVIGEIYRLRPAAKALEQLDSYEGEQFRRERISVRPNGKSAIRAWIYLYTGRVDSHSCIHSGDYVAFLNNSYPSF